jgi:hypothetical protein
MDKLDKLIECISFLRKRFYHVDGLVVLLAAVGMAYFLVTAYIGPHVSALFTGTNWPLSQGLKHGIFLAGLVVVEAAAFLSWLRCRTLPRFSKREIGIVVAPNFPEDLRDEADRLLQYIMQELKSCEFGNRFAVKQLPPNRTINSAEEAAATVRNCRGSVVVWGLLDSQTMPDGTRTGFSSISFTVVHSPARIGLEFHRRVAASMAGREWHVDERNQMIDRKLLAQNIGMVVRNMIGLALLVDRRFDDAIKVFFPLIVDLTPIAHGGSPVEVRRFYSNIKTDAAFCLTSKTEIEYLRELRGNRLFAIPEATLRAWLQSVEEAIKLDGQNSGHYLMKAIYIFLLGDVPQSLTAARGARNKAPKAMSGPNFSLAFLYNFMGDLRCSRNEYRRALAKKTSYDSEALTNIMLFIRQAMVQFPNKPQLRLAIGLLELYRGDPDRGREEIRRFIDEAKHSHGLNDFVEEGRRLLGEDGPARVETVQQ